MQSYLQCTVMRSIRVVLIGVVALCCCSAAQNQADPPGNIVLLPGYQHEPLRGNDSQIGRIWRDRGLSIEYDIGRLAPNRIDRSPNLQWLKEQIVAGKRVQVGLSKDRLLMVVFSSDGVTPRGGSGPTLPAAFTGKVGSDEDIADMMFMVMTYTQN